MKGQGRWKDKARRPCPERGEHKVLRPALHPCARCLCSPGSGGCPGPGDSPCAFWARRAGGADVRCQESVLTGFLTERRGLSAHVLFPCLPGGTVSSELGVVFALVSVRGPFSGVGCPGLRVRGLSGGLCQDGVPQVRVPGGGFVSAFLRVVLQCDPSPFGALTIIYSKCQYILGEKGLSECRLEGIGNAWNSCTAGPGIPGRLGVYWVQLLRRRNRGCQGTGLCFPHQRKAGSEDKNDVLEGTCRWSLSKKTLCSQRKSFSVP